MKNIINTNTTAIETINNATAIETINNEVEVLENVATEENAVEEANNRHLYDATVDELANYIYDNHTFEVCTKRGIILKFSDIEEMLDNIKEFGGDDYMLKVEVEDETDDVYMWQCAAMYTKTIKVYGTYADVDASSTEYYSSYIMVRPCSTKLIDRKKKSHKTYRAYALGKQVVTENRDGALNQLCEEVNIGIDDLIQIDFAGLMISLDQMDAVNRISCAINNGVVISGKDVYYVLDGNKIAPLYAKGNKNNEDAENNKPTEDYVRELKVGDSIFMPCLYTSSGRMDGKLLYVKDRNVGESKASDDGLSKVEALQIAANGTTALDMQRKAVKEWFSNNNIDLFAKVAKSFKYSGLALGAKEELRNYGLVENPHIVVIDTRLKKLSDGGISANTESGLQEGAYQSRLHDTSAKGAIDVNNKLFKKLVNMLNNEYGIDITQETEYIKHYGDASQPISILMDTDSWKHAPYRAQGKNWCVKKYPMVPTAASLSEAAILKLERSFGIDMSDAVRKAYTVEAANKFAAAVHPDANSRYPVSMLAGYYNGCTAANLRIAYSRMLRNGDEAKLTPTTWFKGYNMPIASSMVFNKREASMLKSLNIHEENTHEYIVFVSEETYKLVGQIGMAIRYPETGEHNKSKVHIAVDDRCTDGIVYCATTNKGERFKALHSGMDFDGDKLAIFTIKQSDGKLSALGDLLDYANWESDVIINDFSDEDGIDNEKMTAIETKKFAESLVKNKNAFFAKTYTLDMNQVGSMITYNNIVKLSAHKYQDPVKGAKAYEWEWNMPIDEHQCRVLTRKEIRRWIEYVGQNAENVTLDDNNIKQWRRDVGIVGNWLAECATAISTRGYGIPKDIAKFFRLFANKIDERSEAAEQKAVDAYNANKPANAAPINMRSAAKRKAELGVGEDNHIAEIIVESIDNALHLICDKYCVSTTKEPLPKHVRDDLARTGFYSVIVAAARNTDMRVYDYLNGSIIQNAGYNVLVDGKKARAITMIDSLTINSWYDDIKESYAGEIMPWKAMQYRPDNKERTLYDYETIHTVCDTEQYRNKSIMVLNVCVGKLVSVEDNPTEKTFVPYEHELIKALTALADTDSVAGEKYDDATIVVTSTYKPFGDCFAVCDKKATLMLGKQEVALGRSFINKLSGTTEGKWTIANILSNETHEYASCLYKHYILLLDRSI